MFSNFAHSLPAKPEGPQPTTENAARTAEGPARATDADWTSPQTSVTHAQRWCVRCFALAMFAIIAIETFPRSFLGKPIPLVNAVKSAIIPLTTRLSLWQGEWPLFAPNPVLNNAWLTAEFTDPAGKTTHWNSNYWAKASSWEKFRGFRYMNYYNKLPYSDQSAIDQCADYVARKQISATAHPLSSEPPKPTSESLSGATVWRLKLFRHQMNISMPEDGSLPSRDDTFWVFSSDLLTTREYQP